MMVKGKMLAVLAASTAMTVMSGVVLTTPQAMASTTTTLNETGSSLIYPLFTQEWIGAYEKAHTNVKVSAAATGSGDGISQAMAGTVQIGASDAYTPSIDNSTVLDIPVAVSAQQVMYHVPGISSKTHLKLSGSVLAEIYEGKITKWNDKSIAALNKGVKLPAKTIVPVRREDSSGDTFLFTQFLSDTSSTWSKSVNFGTTVSWPSVGDEIGATGNSGVVQTLKSTPYSVGYVGISWLSPAVKEGIGYAALENRSKQYVLPTSTNIMAAVNEMAPKTPKNEEISLINAPGSKSYPIINYEYLIVKKTQPNSATESAVKTFLNWAVNPKYGNSSKYLAPVNFLPLPSKVEPLSQAQINSIK